MSSHGPIVIAGFGLRLPGGVSTVSQAYDAFRSGESRLSSTAGQTLRLWSRTAEGLPLNAGLVDGPDMFDPAFFGISPRVAQEMDPQQRWALMCATEAIRESGIPLKTLQTCRTGVLVGAGSNDSLVTTFKQPQCFSPYTMQGGTLGNIANLVSFYLDLHGCSASVDTACSSSLTALHLARQSLEAGELDAALVIGTNFLLQPDGFLGFGAAHMLSPTGQSRPFHKDANGFVRSEGCVAMLLVRERMAHALPYARLIRSGVNENGRNTSVTQPQVEAQRVLLEEVVFDTEAPRVAFIEAHGTGTAVGDPIESRSIADRFAPVVASTGRAPIPIGSAKAVFGHLETGSGLVGVLRAALALRFSTVFAQPQLDQSPATVNPAVVASFTSNGTRASPVYIPFNESALEQGYQGFAPLAVINSFGYGGANACVLLEQIPEPTSALEPAPAGMLPLYLRAVSAEHLQAIQASVSTQAPWTQNVAVRLNSATGSGSGLLDRVACVGALNAAGALKWNEVKISAADASQQPKIAYVFGGQGTQHPRMGIDLYRHVSAFRESIDRGDAAYLKLTGVSLKETYGFCVREMSSESLQDVRVSLPCIVLFQVALVDTLAAAGVQPVAVLGHSTGEISAAYAHGLTKLDDIVRAVYGRALGQFLMPEGLMMALFASEDEFAPIHQSLPLASQVHISARNAPRALTLSGSVAGIHQAMKACTEAGLKAIVVPHIQRAYHSPDTFCMRDGFLKDMNAMVLPQVSWRGDSHPAFVSSVTGRVMQTPELNAEYWWQNVCQPVEFVAGCKALQQLNPSAVVEIGSHSVLQRFVCDTFSVPFFGLQSSRSPNSLTDLTKGLVSLASEHRVSVDWTFLRLPGAADKSDFPSCPSPFLLSSFRSAAWRTEPKTAAAAASAPAPAPAPAPLAVRQVTPAPAPVRTVVAAPAPIAVAAPVAAAPKALDMEFVVDHQIRNNIICPGSLFAAESVRSAASSSGAVTVQSLEWRQTVSHPWSGAAPVPNTHVATVTGATAYTLADDAMRFHRPAAPRPQDAAAVAAASATLERLPLDVSALVDQASMSTAYASLREWCKIQFGPRFRLLKSFRADSSRSRLLAVGSWKDNGAADGESRWATCLPTVLDAAFQACGMLVPLSHEAYVPAKLTTLCAANLPQKSTFNFTVVVHLIAISSNSFSFDFDCLVGAHSQPLSEQAIYLQGRGLEMRSLGTPSSALPAVQHQVWRSVSNQLSAVPTGTIRVELGAEHTLGDAVSAVVKATASATKAPLLLVWSRAHPLSGEFRGWSRSLRTERWAEGAYTYAVAVCGGDASAFPADKFVDGEFEIEYTAGDQISAPRVLAWTAAESAASAQHPVVVNCTGGGFAVQWQRAARTYALDADQVRVRVTHTALHFKDVMLALGLLPGFALRLGLEACGEIIECGSDTSFRAGQRVVVLDFGTSDVDARQRAKPSLLATEVVVSAAQCFAADDITDGRTITNDGWAGFLGVYATAWKALEGVRPGDKVLIHSALGGVGQSAIQVARHLGAEIYASAGSPARRQQLSENLGIPIERILDSHRPDSWAAHRAREWKGEGVDWVLNSLAGDAIAAGMRLLAPGGIFVEIGKRDIWDGTPLSMSLLRDNITFRSVHLDLLSDTHPSRVRDACEAVLGLLRSGALQTIPTEVLPASELSFALRRMSQGKHQGKVVIDVQSILQTAVGADGAAPKPLTLSPHALLRLDGTYVVTGATSGVGLAYVQLLLTQGVRRVVMLSRSSRLNARATLQLARFAGRFEVSTESDWAKVLSTYKPSGVVHFAAHYTAGAALAYDSQSWGETMKAKAYTWQSLCSAVESAASGDVASLDFVATTTSLAGLYGNDMQAAYAAANVACVDTLSPSKQLANGERRAVASICLDLPMVLAAGRLSDHTYGAELWYNAKKGFRAAACWSLFTALHTVATDLISSVASQSSRVPSTHILVEPTPFADVATRISNPRLFAELTTVGAPTPVSQVPAASAAPAAASAPVKSVAQVVSAAPKSIAAPTVAPTAAPVARSNFVSAFSASQVTDMLRDQMSTVLGLSPEKITQSWSEPLSDVGLDSLGAMELRSWMQKCGAWDPAVLTPALLLAPTTSCELLVELSQSSPGSGAGAAPAATAVAAPVSAAPTVVSAPVVVRPAIVQPTATVQRATVATFAASAPAPAPAAAAVGAAMRASDVTNMLVEQMSTVLGLSADKIVHSWSEPLSDVGLDSLGAMELRSWMQKCGAWDPSVLTPALLLSPTTTCESLVDLSQSSPGSGSGSSDAVHSDAHGSHSVAVSQPAVVYAQPVAVSRPVAVAAPAPRPATVLARPAPSPVPTPAPAAVHSPAQAQSAPAGGASFSTAQVTNMLVEQMSTVLGLSADKIVHSWSEPLSDVGLDSLGAMELRSWMQKCGAWDPSVLTPALLLSPTTTCESLVDLSQSSPGSGSGSSDAPASASESSFSPVAVVAAPVAAPIAAPIVASKPRVQSSAVPAREPVVGMLEVRGTFAAADCWQWIELLRAPVAEYGPLVVQVIDAIGMDLRQPGGFAGQAATLDAYAVLLEELNITKRPLLVVSDGFVRGGSMIWAMHATCHVCTPQTTFGFPEVQHDGLPALVSSGAAYRGIPVGALRRYLITGDVMSADVAQRLGLVDEVASVAGGWNEARAILDRWAATVAGNRHIITKSELPYPSREAAVVALGRALQAPERAAQLEIEQAAESDGIRVSMQLLRPHDDPSTGDFIATVELVDNERHNALSLATARALRRYADLWRTEKRLRAVIVLPGSDVKNFGSGLHSSMVDYWKSGVPSVFEVAQEVHTLYDGYTSLRSLPVPIVALVSGAAVGGGLAFALNADVRMATSETRFVYGNRSRGVCPGLHLSQWLIDALGFPRALDWYRDEAVWTANAAVEQGVVHSVHPNRDAAWAAALAYLQPMLESSNEGVRQTLSLIRAAIDPQRIWREAVGMAECMRNGAFAGSSVNGPTNSIAIPRDVPKTITSSAIVASAPAPSSFGIEAMAVYIPVNRVAQPDLEKMHSCEGKYTRGLGQRAIAVPAANEDSVSMAFTALSRLMVAAGEPTDIGFLAVATESMVDRSKSIKSELVDRLGLTDTEGTDVYHACYGSTAAILWALDWLASGRGHGKRAIVVCTDIAEWGPEYCFLNGAASVALLLGPNPVVQLDASTSATISYNGHDFCKPLEQPYPVFDGPDSVESLTNVLRKCLARVPWGNSDFSYLVPHCTTAMMCRRASDTAADFFGVPAKDRASYFAAKVDPCTHWVRDIGSMFTAAMWVNLACLLSQGQAVNTNIALFSYGSGTMGTLWRARVVRALPAGSALIVAPEGVDTPSVSPSQCSALVRWQSAEEWLQLQRSTKMLAPSTAFALIGEEQVGRRKYALAEDADAGGGAA